METIEYRTVDKSSWPRGEWDDEPDKKQWQDEATGLPCLIVRNRMGALCGYVGVPEKHPLHGKSYSERILVPDRNKIPLGARPSPIALLIEASKEDDGCCSLDVLADVHGGITYANSCAEHTEARWAKWRESMLKRRADIERYPQGDAANDWRDYGKYVDDFHAWQQWCVESSICHLPATGEPDKVWWFGFDCSHSGDLMPQMARHFGVERDETYRSVEYVTAECERLAKQLAALAA